MFAGGDPEFVVEAVMPNLLHVVPVVDDAVFDRIAEFQHSLLGLRLFSHIGVLVHADHDVLILGSAHNRWERGSGGVVAGEAGLAHAGTVVNNHWGSLLIAHLPIKLCA